MQKKEEIGFLFPWKHFSLWQVVRLSAGFIVFLCLIQNRLWAESNGGTPDTSLPELDVSETGDSDREPSSVDPEKLPNIEAQTFRVRVDKRSQSNRVYLFQSPEPISLSVGRLFLLKNEKASVMAFRVLKTYPDSKSVAARRVRWYGENRVLDENSEFTGIEKIADLPFKADPRDDKDLKEVEQKPGLKIGDEPTAGPTPSPSINSENPASPLPSLASSSTSNKAKGKMGEVAEFDPELDTSENALAEKQKTGNMLGGTVDTDSDAFEDELARSDDENQSLVQESTKAFDSYRHNLMGSFAFVRHGSGAPGGTGLLMAAGVRYGFTPLKQILFSKSSIQDSLTLEIGAFFSRLYLFINSTANDSYTLGSFLGTVRYQLTSAKGLGAFLYVGGYRNQVLSAQNTTDDALSLLNRFFPSAGVGLTFEVGPSWDLRVDIGYDVISLGLALRF